MVKATLKTNTREGGTVEVVIVNIAIKVRKVADEQIQILVLFPQPGLETGIALAEYPRNTRDRRRVHQSNTGGKLVREKGVIEKSVKMVDVQALLQRRTLPKP